MTKNSSNRFEFGPFDDCTPKPTRSSTANQEQQEAAVLRERQWLYLGPIAAAPIAHICVTLYRGSTNPQTKRLLLGAGIIGSTVATVGMRLCLMNHAGYPGGNNSHATQREIAVSSREEKERVENPGVGHVVREMLRGFG